MKLHANVTRFAPSDGYIMDVEKLKKAAEEQYDFFFISPGWYLCVSGENMYTISEYMQKIGCACHDMTFSCTNRSVCKHLIAFMALKDLPDRDISADMRELLIAAGWSGKTLTPPDRPEQRKRTKLPNVHDPARTPQPQAATRADNHKRYASMTPEEIIKETPQKELETYAKRGAPMAKVELARREAERAVSA